MFPVPNIPQEYTTLPVKQNMLFIQARTILKPSVWLIGYYIGSSIIKFTKT